MDYLKQIAELFNIPPTLPYFEEVLLNHLTLMVKQREEALEVTRIYLAPHCRMNERLLIDGPKNLSAEYEAVKKDSDFLHGAYNIQRAYCLSEKDLAGAKEEGRIYKSSRGYPFIKMNGT